MRADHDESKADMSAATAATAIAHLDKFPVAVAIASIRVLACTADLHSASFPRAPLG
jgi:hypothetical protein